MEKRSERGYVNAMFRVITAAVLLAVTLPALAAPEDTSGATTATARPHYESPLTIGFDLQWSPIAFNNYSWAEGFQTSKSGQGAHFALEWLPFADRYGKPAIGVGTGFYTITNIDTDEGRTHLDVLPIELFVSYRLDFLPHQIIVPFAKVGVSNYLTKQVGVADPVRAGVRSYRGLDYSLGIELCLSAIDRYSARALDRGFGINDVYFVFEYLKSSFLSGRSDPDLTRNEYRFGLRFEI